MDYGLRLSQFQSKSKASIEQFLHENHFYDPLAFQDICETLSFCVYNTKGKLVACILVTNALYINYLVVDAKFRKRGIASFLIRQALSKVQRNETMRLTCNMSLGPFYERFGFLYECISDTKRVEMLYKHSIYLK
jgi:predicted GNAT family N-acyltransferase